MNWIAHEHIKWIRLKDFLLIVLLAFITALAVQVAQELFSPSTMYYLFLALFIAVMNGAVYLLKKSGVAVLFSAIIAALTYNVDDIGVLGWNKVAAFFVAALVFEAVFLVLKLRVKSVPVDMVVGSALLTAVLPLMAAFVLSPTVILSFPVALLNLVLVSFVVGLAASFSAFIVWHFISQMRFILRLEAYFGAL